MAEKEKNTRSFTGLTEFLYGELDEKENKIKEEKATRIEFLQDISITTDQTMEKAYGDNIIAEMAVATDASQLTTQFHTIPLEDRAILYGYENEDEIYGLPEAPNPPYVACMFTKTREDGSAEYIGFTQGKFMLADEEGETKGESVEFGNMSTEGEFMPRKVDGFKKKMTFLVAGDDSGETTNRGALYKKIFGVEHPDAKKEEGDDPS